MNRRFLAAAVVGSLLVLLTSWTTAVADPGVLQVDIDVKPGSEPSCLNNNGHGVIPVAILGTPAPVLLHGDSNLDGVFDKADYKLLLEWLHGPMPEPGTLPFTVSDVNGDLVLNMDDLVLFWKRLFGFIEKFPVSDIHGNGLDVRNIDPITVRLDGMPIKITGKSGKPLAHVEDVNGDGLDDLVVQIRDTGDVFSPGDSIATLTGALYDGTPIEGTDFICIVPERQHKP